MHNYKLIVSYDGTDFGGWQIQPNAPSIQEALEKALSTYLRKPIKVTGSGRTDSGVHALGQVAHFKSESLIKPSSLSSINALLPKSICVLQLDEAPLDFHARKSARSKIYRYCIYRGKCPGPFIQNYVTNVWDPIDLKLLKKALHEVIGVHDFASFANVNKSRPNQSTIREIYRIDVIEKGPHLQLLFEGNGFLYKMVRNLTGGLLAVATKKMSLADFISAKEEKKRTKAIPAAPAKGLFLERVFYEDTTEACESSSNEGAYIAPFFTQ